MKCTTLLKLQYNALVFVGATVFLYFFLSNLTQQYINVRSGGQRYGERLSQDGIGSQPKV